MQGECVGRLMQLGINEYDARQLRRIAMTLHRWHELECGDSNNWNSWAIVRGNKKDRMTFEYDDNGKPYMETHPHDGKTYYTRIADRENGAKRRLNRIMANYPTLSAYIQGDPRGASLYIGENLTDSNYNRGIAVYK